MKPPRKRPLALPGDVPETSTQLWMIPYADLMSTLVILFLALFAYSYSNRSPEYDKALSRIEVQLAEGKKDEDEALRRQREAELVLNLQEEIKRLKLSEFGIEMTARRIRLTLPAPVLFPAGSARLEPSAEPILESLGRLFAELPNPVLIEGHTDDRPLRGGRHRNNWELSAARAFAVADFFSKKGLDAERFHARGYADQKPAAGNETPEGRKRNRRIEISLFREIRRS